MRLALEFTCHFFGLCRDGCFLQNVSSKTAKNLKPPPWPWLYAGMKALPLLLLAMCLSACRAAPWRSPYSPGGRAVTPIERHDRSPLSPGGRVVTPRERYHRHH